MSFFNESDEAESQNGFGFEEIAPKRRRFPWRQIVGYSLTAAFLGGVAYAFNAPTPYVIEQPGTIFNVLGDNNGGKVITISGATTYETASADTAGKLFLLTVGLRGQPGHTPSWVEIFQAWADPKMKVLPIEAVYAPGISSTQSTAEDFAMMKDSQQQATAAALRQLGYKIPNRVTVYSVTKNTPADGVLQAKDVITAVNGAALANGDTLRTLVKDNADKKPLDLTLSRGSHTLHEQVTPVQIKGTWRMGISIVDTYDFPFSVKLRLQNVGGPSGGLMFALGIIDKLTPGSLTGGQSVAGTGEIDGNGNVYPIGGIQQKMWGAVGQGATWFLAPADNCDEVVGHIPEGLHVTKVLTLQDSLDALKAIAANPKTTALPQCTATK